MGLDAAAAPHSSERLVAVTLDEVSFGRGNPDQDRERRIAIESLVESNRFRVSGIAGGPFRLDLKLRDGKLLFAVSDEGGGPVVTHGLSLKPFRNVVKDYLLVCETHYAAYHAPVPGRLEAIDMGRRSLHDEGAALLGERLRGKIESDFETLRRLFTLLTALHWKG